MAMEGGPGHRGLSDIPEGCYTTADYGMQSPAVANNLIKFRGTC